MQAFAYQLVYLPMASSIALHAGTAIFVPFEYELVVQRISYASIQD